ncbi:unnamed protein product [Aspergillus oryzae var. brunneus]|uniref:Ankyrin repeat-containing domain-containing protein n=2 Tax=Aspergillus oryzae TaxID=5062 RepID=A0A1S9DX59_ASPOZ|nr:Ankyrin repeat-containing domain-containing protein [Aspergillus oryzae]GMG16917.1 unnamed protein product [Aspergillus oryzae]GMG38713.1 unnamed protein product [Aspergillus oryzae]GMG55208.1 unnamed protein product [Aspergillus oryzae var. brunneus]
MSLLVLPTELLLSILDSLDKASDILSLCRTHPSLYTQLLRALYIFNVKWQDSSALHWAASHGNLRLARILGSYGANINSLIKGVPPLHHAVSCQQTNLIKWFLSWDHININVQDPFYKTALHHAVLRNNEEAVALLLQKENINVNKQDIHGMTPLHRAILLGNLSIIQQLLNYSSIDLELRGMDGHWGIWNESPPLCVAVMRGRLDIVRLLLLFPINVNNCNKDGKSALHLAVDNNDHNLVKLLLDQPGIDVNIQDNVENSTPLHNAVELARESIVKLLLGQQGINPNVRDSYGDTALHIAAKFGDPSIAKLLLNKPGLEINMRDHHGQTPLWWATKNNHLSLVKQLLAESHVDVNTVGQDASTSLHHAVENRSSYLVMLLLCTNGIDVNISDESEKTPLEWAVHQGDIQMVEILLLSPTIKIESALGTAAKLGHIWIVKLLLWRQPNADLNFRDGSGMTALAQAAFAGHDNIVKYLLQRRHIDVNLHDFNRCTPLWWAAKRGHLDIVVQLVNDSRTVFNSRLHRCPRDEAKYWGHSDIANLLTYVIDKKNPLTLLN